MSEVFSFRLDEKNPREAQAMGVIKALAEKGYSLRQIIIEALLLLGDQEQHSPEKTDDITKTVERLFSLVERLEGRLEPRQKVIKEKSELNDSFLSSVKLAAKSGLKRKKG
jgi:hypothetical protein